MPVRDEEGRMRRAVLRSAFVGLVAVAVVVDAAPQRRDLPNPYREVADWATLPAGMSWGGVIAVEPAADGGLWVFHRADPPILRFDRSGALVASFGGGMFVQAHGLAVDPDGNVWVTDAQIKDGRGNQAFKFSPDGRLLMTLGKAGVAGGGPDVFSGPCDVVVAPNGDIFVADGHMADTPVNRIVKFSKDGRFIKAWGRRGSAPGEFDTPHSLAMDSRGRLFVADRGNNRIQIFDQDGTFLAQWTQFGRPSGVFIDRHDVLYVADSQSNTKQNPGFTRGIRIGSAVDGTVTAMIPVVEGDPEQTNNAGVEGVAADAAGNVYAGAVTAKMLYKFARP
jgi:sugar lactone lactonase YvrE